MKKPSSAGKISVFATPRGVGDALDPRAVTDTVHVAPTTAHRKGETLSSPNTDRSRTTRFGLWYFSTREVAESAELVDHLLFLARNILLEPTPLTAAPVVVLQPNARLKKLVASQTLEFVVSAFWLGEPAARPPSIPAWFNSLLDLYGGRIERDFGT